MARAIETDTANIRTRPSLPPSRSRAGENSPPYSTRFTELPGIYEDHPCTPVHNVLANNTYCHDKVKGQFVDRDDATIKSWYSTIENNVEKC